MVRQRQGLIYRLDRHSRLGFNWARRWRGRPGRTGNLYAFTGDPSHQGRPGDDGFREAQLGATVRGLHRLHDLLHFIVPAYPPDQAATQDRRDHALPNGRDDRQGVGVGLFPSRNSTCLGRLQGNVEGVNHGHQERGLLHGELHDGFPMGEVGQIVRKVHVASQASHCMNRSTSQAGR
ncbi:hypothetical protein FQZ97_952730 [compost metagenome]